MVTMKTTQLNSKLSLKLLKVSKPSFSTFVIHLSSYECNNFYATLQIAQSFPGVDRMYHVPSGVRIGHASELRDGDCYVVACRDKYIPAAYKLPNEGPALKIRFVRIK